MYSRGVTGKGVGVALVDTGVVPVRGLTSGNVVNGPDLSFESQSGDAAAPGHLRPRHPHGRHHRRRRPVVAAVQRGVPGHRARRAADQPQGRRPPRARWTSRRSSRRSTGSWRTATTTRANPIRVLNLSYGTDGVQDYRLDPLAHAVENAWRAGIVVVVAGGNSGTDSPQLNNPAYDPYVLAVGAADTNGHRRRLRRPRARVQQPRRRQPPGRPGRPRPLDQVAARPGLLPRRGAPGRARRQPVLQGQRLVAGRGRRLGCRRAAAAEPARPDGRTRSRRCCAARPSRCRPPTPPVAAPASSTSTAPSSPRPPPRPRRWPISTGLGSLEQARGTQHVADGDQELTGERHPLGDVRRPHLGTGQRRVQGLVRRRLGRRVLDRRLLVRVDLVRASPGPASPGPASRGPATPGPASRGPASPGPAARGPASPGRAPAGPAAAGWASPGPARSWAAADWGDS